MESIEKIVARQLLDVNAVKLSVDKPFTWASGWKSPIYCDNRKILSYPAARKVVYEAFIDIIKEKFKDVDIIAGVATGAIAYGVLVAEAMGKPFIYVRPKPKDHGTGAQVEGELPKGARVVIVEDLHVRNMTRAAAGTIEAPGHNVWATARRNLSILDQGWFEFRRQLDYKLKWLGGRLIAVPPQHTSQRCSRCGHTDARSRRTQADFRCTACGFESNADHNAALNILAAGQAVAACGSGRAQAPALNQEPTCGAA